MARQLPTKTKQQQSKLQSAAGKPQPTKGKQGKGNATKPQPKQATNGKQAAKPGNSGRGKR